MADKVYAKLQFCSGHAPNFWCVDLRVKGQRGAVATTGYYPSPDMAVDEADQLWRISVDMTRNEYEICETNWQIQGAQMYANDVPFEICHNHEIAQGWMIAFQSDVQYRGVTMEQPSTCKPRINVKKPVKLLDERHRLQRENYIK